MSAQSIARSYIALMDEADKLEALTSLDANGVVAKESDMGRRYVDLSIGGQKLLTINKWALTSDGTSEVPFDLGYQFDRGYLRRVEA